MCESKGIVKQERGARWAWVREVQQAEGRFLSLFWIMSMVLRGGEGLWVMWMVWFFCVYGLMPLVVGVVGSGRGWMRVGSAGLKVLGVGSAWLGLAGWGTGWMWVGVMGLAMQDGWWGVKPIARGAVGEARETRLARMHWKRMRAQLAMVAALVASVALSGVGTVGLGWFAGAMVVVTLVMMAIVREGRDEEGGETGERARVGRLRKWKEGRAWMREHDAYRKLSYGEAYYWVGLAILIGCLMPLVEWGMGHGGGAVVGMGVGVVTIGLGVGYGVSAMMNRRVVELGWVPLAGLWIVGVGIALGLGVEVWVSEIARGLRVGEGWSGSGLGWGLGLWMLGFGVAMFGAPIRVAMLDLGAREGVDASEEMVNLQNGMVVVVVGLSMVGLDWVLRTVGVGVIERMQVDMGLFVISGMLAMGMALKMLPAELLRMMDRAVVRYAYRLRVSGAERIPAVGGVLLLPNHVTFIDAFLLTAASPRPVRFVMDQAFIAHRGIALFTKLFDTVNIRRDQPLEAIREVIRSLKAGDVICLFPEGQLTRTGGLCPLQRGFEVIIKKAGHPVLPVWVDGSWGSLASFERGCFFRKRPKRLVTGVNVAFGEVMEAKLATLERVRDGLLECSTVAVGLRYRRAAWANRKPRGKGGLVEAMRAMEGDELRQVWVNGHQVGMAAGLSRGGVVHLLEGDEEVRGLLGVLVAFPEIYGGSVQEHPRFEAGQDGQWLGGDRLREAIEGVGRVEAAIEFYDFGSRAQEELRAEGVVHGVCLAVAGRVVSMSMPDPPETTDDVPTQYGMRDGSWGRLLPGWQVKAEVGGGVSVHGPAAGVGGLVLPSGIGLDRDGFLVRQEQGD